MQTFLKFVSKSEIMIQTFRKVAEITEDGN